MIGLPTIQTAVPGRLAEPITRLVTIAGRIHSRNSYQRLTVTLLAVKTFEDQRNQQGAVIGKKRVVHRISKRVELYAEGYYRIVGLVRYPHRAEYLLRIERDGQRLVCYLVVAGYTTATSDASSKRRGHTQPDLFI